MSATTFRTFFGDAEREFRLGPSEIAALESKLKVGIGALWHRILNIQFSSVEIAEIIRLGLIGGGTKPKEAADLVEAYSSSRPVAETHALAFSIIAAAWFGVDAAKAIAPEADEAPANG